MLNEICLPFQNAIIWCQISFLPGLSSPFFLHLAISVLLITQNLQLHSQKACPASFVHTSIKILILNVVNLQSQLVPLLFLASKRTGWKRWMKERGKEEIRNGEKENCVPQLKKKVCPTVGTPALTSYFPLPLCSTEQITLEGLLWGTSIVFVCLTSLPFSGNSILLFYGKTCPM